MQCPEGDHLIDEPKLSITEKGKTCLYFCKRHEAIKGNITGAMDLFLHWWESGADPRTIDEYIESS